MRFEFVLKAIVVLVLGMVPLAVLTFIILDMRPTKAVATEQNFIAQDKLDKTVLANGLLELTERVMVLEKLEHINKDVK